jgi:hypothetical protein
MLPIRSTLFIFLYFDGEVDFNTISYENTKLSVDLNKNNFRAVQIFQHTKFKSTF